MWVRKTEKELQDSIDEQKKVTVAAELITLLILFLSLVFLYKAGYSKMLGIDFPINWKDVLKNIHRIALFFVGLFFIHKYMELLINKVLHIYWNLNNTLVCERCNKVKLDDGNEWCECQGHFVNIRKMKWIEDDEKSGLRFLSHEKIKIQKEETKKQNQINILRQHNVIQCQEIILPVSKISLKNDYLIKRNYEDRVDAKHNLKFVEKIVINSKISYIFISLTFLFLLLVYVSWTVIEKNLILGWIGIVVFVFLVILCLSNVYRSIMVVHTKFNNFKYRILDPENHFTYFEKEVNKRIVSLKNNFG